jgi:hypothetical protein
VSIGENGNPYKSLRGKVERRASPGRPSCEQEENIRWDGVDWIDLAQDRDKWRALVNFGFHTMLGVLTAAQLAGSQEGISSLIELAYIKPYHQKYLK